MFFSYLFELSPRQPSWILVFAAMDVPAELVAFAEDLADVSGKVILQSRGQTGFSK